MDVSPHPHIPALRDRKNDSSPQNLSDWATSILEYHQTPDSVLEWEAVSIKWFKNKSGFEHEYPIFTLRNKSTPSTEICLRFDRRSSEEAVEARKEEAIVARDVYSTFSPDQRKKVKATVKKEGKMLSKPMKSFFNMSKTSSAKDNGLQPKDTIMRCWPPRDSTDSRKSDKADLLVTYSDFSRPFPLRDLVIIAKIVVESADAYLLLVQQCYWFTRTMVGISITLYHRQPATGRDNITHDRSGRINQLPFVPIVNQENPDEIETLVKRVNEAIAVDDKKVGARYMNGEGGRIKAEKELAVAEERRVAAENARVVAEKAQAAAEEACAQAENRIRELEQLAAGPKPTSPSV